MFESLNGRWYKSPVFHSLLEEQKNPWYRREVKWRKGGMGFSFGSNDCMALIPWLQIKITYDAFKNKQKNTYPSQNLDHLNENLWRGNLSMILLGWPIVRIGYPCKIPISNDSMISIPNNLQCYSINLREDKTMPWEKIMQTHKLYAIKQNLKLITMHSISSKTFLPSFHTYNNQYS